MSKRRSQGQIIPKGPGTWGIRWYIGRDEAGKIKQSYETVRGTRRDAETRLREVLQLKDQGVRFEPKRISVGQHLNDWLDSLEGKRARRTVDGYRDLVKWYVAPSVGARRLDKLALGHVEDDLVGRLQAEDKSPRTIRLAVTVLGAACKWGVRRGRLIRNPCEGVQLPESRRQEMRALSPDEVKKFRRAVAGTRYAVLFDFLLFTGARPGEAYGLQWKDLDLDAGGCRIRQALSRSGNSWELRAPKAKSERSLPLPPTLVAALRAHRREQAARVLELGAYYRRDLDLVFANEIGEPLQHRNVVFRHFKPRAADAGIAPEIRLYDLRHTHATNLLAAGVPVNTVSARLGHASAKMTLDVYGHTLPHLDQRAADVVEDLFGA